MGEYVFMDLLYSRYASPMDFMHLYIEQGRFGEFVTEIIEMDYKRKEEQAKKEDEQKMWDLYIHSMSDKSFNDWKKEVMRTSHNHGSQDENMTDADIEGIINRLFPEG